MSIPHSSLGYGRPSASPQRPRASRPRGCVLRRGPTSLLWLPCARHYSAISLTRSLAHHAHHLQVYSSLGADSLSELLVLVLDRGDRDLHDCLQREHFCGDDWCGDAGPGGATRARETELVFRGPSCGVQALRPGTNIH